MNGLQHTAFIIKQMKNHCKKKLGVITGVKARNEKTISTVDITKLANATTSSSCLQ